MIATAKTISINGERKKSSMRSHFGNNFQRPSRMSNNGERVSHEINKANDLNAMCLFMISNQSNRFT